MFPLTLSSMCSLLAAIPANFDVSYLFYLIHMPSSTVSQTHPLRVTSDPIASMKLFTAAGRRLTTSSLTSHYLLLYHCFCLFIFDQHGPAVLLIILRSYPLSLSFYVEDCLYLLVPMTIRGTQSKGIKFCQEICKNT